VFDDVWRSTRQGNAMTKTMPKAVTQEESREPVKKTPADHLTDTLAQLKEMRHYSKTNVEHLTAVWLLFDGELSKLKRTEKIEDLMNRQSQLHEALEAVIADLEEALQKLQP
jgi:multidrug resistance efflux pump